MKTQNIIRILFSVLCCLFFFTISFAGNYTWTGNTSSSWTTTTNWSPNGNPSTNDSVKIMTGTNNCLMAANTTVKKFTVTADTIDFNGYTLTVNSDISISGGFVKNGSLISQSGSSVSFSGGTISTTVNVNGTTILFDGAIFNNTVTAIFKGSSASTGRGGNVFNSTVTLTDSGSGFWTFGNSTADTCNDLLSVTNTSSGTIYLAHNSYNNFFKKTVNLLNTSSGTIQCAYYRTASFDDSLKLSCTGSGAVRFGYGGGSVLLSSYLGIGSSGLSSSGTIDFQRVHQSNHSLDISLTGSGTSAISFGSGSEFEGNVTASAPALALDGSTFDKKAILTHTGNLTTNCRGNCTFMDSTWIYHSNSSGGSFYLGTSGPDNYTKPVTIENTDRGKIVVTRGVFSDKTIFINNSPFATSSVPASPSTSSPYSFYVADGSICSFNSSLTLKSDSGNIAFGTSHGSARFYSSSSLKIDSSYFGSLFLSNVDYASTTKIIIPFASNSCALFLDSNNVFSAPVNCSAQHVQLNGSTFNDTLLLKSTTLDSDTSKGGNTFNGLTIFTDSNTVSSKSMILARLYPDDFNGNVIFKQYSKGKIYPCHTKNSTFKGDIYVLGDSTIYFGYGGGRVILDGDTDNAYTQLGVAQPQFKKVEINKSGGSFILKDPMTISDSLFFTKGYFVSDSLRPLIIPDNGIVTGASDSSFVNGLVKKIGNDAFTFPLGNVDTTGGYYHSISISAPSSSTDVFAAEFIYDDHGLGSSSDSTIQDMSDCEYWKLKRYVGSSSVTVKLGWNSNSCNVIQLLGMKVAAWNGSTWKDLGNGATTGNIAKGTVISDAATNIFGTYTLSNVHCYLTAHAGSNQAACAGDSVTIGTSPAATGNASPFSYLWTPMTGLNTDTSSIVKACPRFTTDYILTATDSKGCINTDTVNVEMYQSAPPVIKPSELTVDCNGNYSVTLTSSVGTSYLWNNAETTRTIIVDDTGAFSVTVTDSNGCESTSLVTYTK